MQDFSIRLKIATAFAIGLIGILIAAGNFEMFFSLWQVDLFLNLLGNRKNVRVFSAMVSVLALLLGSAALYAYKVENYVLLSALL